MPESWMLARLQRETELYHGDADTHRIAMIGGSITIERYREFLGRVYGFEAPCEAALALTDDLDLVVDLRARAQIKLLRSDLLALGIVDPMTLPRCTSIAIRDVPDALGLVYVLERNTHLHGLVDRHLRGQFPDAMRLAGSYLTGQTRSAGTRWRELGDALDRIAYRPSIADRISIAAKAAFRAQRGWYELAAPPAAIRVA